MEKTFKDWWKNLTRSDQDKYTIILSQKCNVSLATVKSWGYGYRTPKSRAQEVIRKSIKEKITFS